MEELREERAKELVWKEKREATDTHIWEDFTSLQAGNLTKMISTEII